MKIRSITNFCLFQKLMCGLFFQGSRTLPILTNSIRIAPSKIKEKHFQFFKSFVTIRDQWQTVLFIVPLINSRAALIRMHLEGRQGIWKFLLADSIPLRALLQKAHCAMLNQTPNPDFFLHNRSFFKLPNAAPSLFKILAQCGIAPAATIKFFPLPPPKKKMSERRAKPPQSADFCLFQTWCAVFFKKKFRTLKHGNIEGKFSFGRNKSFYGGADLSPILTNSIKDCSPPKTTTSYNMNRGNQRWQSEISGKQSFLFSNNNFESSTCQNAFKRTTRVLKISFGRLNSFAQAHHKT